MIAVWIILAILIVLRLVSKRARPESADPTEDQIVIVRMMPDAEPVFRVIRAGACPICATRHAPATGAGKHRNCAGASNARAPDFGSGKRGA